MKVLFLKSIAGRFGRHGFGSFEEGREYDLPDDLVAPLLKKGVCRETKAPAAHVETAMRPAAESSRHPAAQRR